MQRMYSQAMFAAASLLTLTAEPDGFQIMRMRADSGCSIRYEVNAVDPHGHLFEVRLVVQDPDPTGLRLALAAWIPGSYLIRDFARHVIDVEAQSNGRRVSIEKTDKHTWQLAPCRGPISVRYRVYAWDLSVRGAHLDASHGFFNGTSLFLRVLGRESEPHQVELCAPSDPALADWKVATTLPRAGAAQWGFGLYEAADYDELIDHPVEMGRFTVVEFQACGTPHAMVITGRHDCDASRLAKDLSAICEAQIRLFEPRKRQAPFERYLFLTTVVGDGYGGLEHRASTALIAARADLPHAGMQKAGDGYRRFLGLASHEYFHAWNVKRIKPAAFTPYDLERENYTRLLWVFEGFTSYYDDLMLVRSGAIKRDAYLNSLASTITQVARSPGRLLQSVAESSFEAWTKYYRQDENSPNVIVSYYTKGALVALCLDLTIRLRSQGRRSLDDVMRLLWNRHGKTSGRKAPGMTEDEFPTLLERATGVRLDDEIARWAYGTDELPLAELLGHFGINLERKDSGQHEAMLGARITSRNSEALLSTVYSGGASHRAGLSAGDTLIALEGLRVDESKLKAMLARRAAGDSLRIHAFRRDELLELNVTLDEPLTREVALRPDDKASGTAKKQLDQWLR